MGPIRSSVARLFPEYASKKRREALAAYLRDGIGIVVTPDDIERWVDKVDHAARLLVLALGEPLLVESSSENILLALPLMTDGPRAREGVDKIVTDYAHAIQELHEAGDVTMLAAIAEYGRRWEMIAEVDVPIGRPTTMSVREDQPLLLGRHATFRHVLALRDARSVHLQLSLDDRSLEFDGIAEMTGAAGEPLPLFEGARQTAEYQAFYTSSPDRPDAAVLRARLRPTHDMRMVSGAILAMVALSTMVTVTAEPDAAVLAALAIPTTFSVSLLLVREPASLARRLLRWRKKLILAVASMLWIAVVIQLLRLPDDVSTCCR